MHPEQTSQPEPNSTPEPSVPALPQQQFSAQSDQQAPQTTPQQAQTFVNTEFPQTSAPSHHTNASTIVLQWLTYAFWGWTVLIMSILTAVVLSTLLGDNETNSFTIYAVAGILVLLPISVVCDVFYSKQEPDKKTGAASIVMVIHAVLFALFGIGALIGAVFSLVSMFTSSSDSTVSQVALYSSIIIFFLYVATFLRTLNPPKFPWIRRAFTIFMVLSVGIVAVFGIVGPAAHERATRTDRLIDENLYQVTDSISSYSRKNNSLPSNLSQLSLHGDAKKLIDDNLVRYEANALPASSNLNNTSTSSYSTYTYNLSNKTYYYQLCVDYKKEKKDKYSSYRDDYSTDKDGYTSYISTSSHPAGEKCYKVKTTDY
jgi:hypothetical protein